MLCELPAGIAKDSNPGKRTAIRMAPVKISNELEVREYLMKLKPIKIFAGFLLMCHSDVTPGHETLSVGLCNQRPILWWNTH